MYTIKIVPRRLHFKQPAGTSRGSYTTRDVWYLHLTSDEYPDRVGMGECAPLPNLSCDDLPEYESVLARVCDEVVEQGAFLLRRFGIIRRSFSDLRLLSGIWREAVLIFGIRLFHVVKSVSLSMDLSGWEITGRCWNR